MEWQSKRIDAMINEIGNRVEFREVAGTSLLQHRKFRDYSPVGLRRNCVPRRRLAQEPSVRSSCRRRVQASKILTGSTLMFN
jgi:hypothetical protein